MMTVKQRQALRTGLRLAAAVAITVLFLFPIYWLFMISFKTPEEIYSFRPSGIRAASISTTTRCSQGRRRDHGLEQLRSRRVSTVIAMFLGTICAYSLARFRPGEQLDNWIISQRMIPRSQWVPDLPAVRVARTGGYLPA